MRCVELFTGCGGLAMGLSRAGFQPQRMIEWDRHAVGNVSHNKGRGIDFVEHWPIEQRDVREIDWTQYNGLALVAGGPPCQPFSIGGKHRGHDDHRDMWPEAVRAVREAKPRGFAFENVRGLARAAFSDYLEWILLSLSMPHIERLDGENSQEHLERLRTLKRTASYQVRFQQVNAADFGAAQKRFRVLVLGVRKDIGLEPPILVPTHSREALLWDQWVSGDYWRRHNIRRPASGPMAVDVGTLHRLERAGIKPVELPWRTIRDAIVGLGEPGTRGILNHDPQLGARSYPGHTGSTLDYPSKALKAGVHGVPGGENTLSLPDGRIRYYTVREAARLQGLPDDYEFVGSWSENMRQLGNAVPVQLAEAVAKAMRAVVGDV